MKTERIRINSFDKIMIFVRYLIRIIRILIVLIIWRGGVFVFDSLSNFIQKRPVDHGVSRYYWFMTARIGEQSS